ncbi:MAG: hypothetical protein SX243_19570 [Acidobacteriota bacterium]|nr:hypothetical protein [Acidobacteriota bacterium]
MKVLRLVLSLALALSAWSAFSPPIEASEGCTPFLCYVDLVQGTFICPNSAVYPHVQIDPVVETRFNPECDTSCWHAAVVTISVPEECTEAAVWVEYEGVPEGWTLNFGDSASNDGWGGDFDSPPINQNAELQVLDDELTLFEATNDPPVENRINQRLVLEDGALRAVVKDQFVSWGQPYSFSESFRQRLFFLPPAPGDRTLYVGLNRVIRPVNAQNTTRTGCGLRRAIITVR